MPKIKFIAEFDHLLGLLLLFLMEFRDSENFLLD